MMWKLKHNKEKYDIVYLILIGERVGYYPHTSTNSMANRLVGLIIHFKEPLVVLNDNKTY